MAKMTDIAYFEGVDSNEPVVMKATDDEVKAVIYLILKSSCLAAGMTEKEAEEYAEMEAEKPI